MAALVGGWGLVGRTGSAKIGARPAAPIATVVQEVEYARGHFAQRS
jgi:hypothetical protein